MFMFRLCVVVCLAGCLVQAVSQDAIEKCRLSGTYLLGTDKLALLPAPYTGTEQQCIDACLQKAECVAVGWWKDDGTCLGAKQTRKQMTYTEYNSFLMSCVKAAEPACYLDVTNSKNIGTKVEYKSTITVECEEGYALQGKSNLLCSKDNQFSPAPPSCRKGETRLQDLGCWADSADRAIPTLESKDTILDGNYNSREDAIIKCQNAAYKRGWSVFGVQAGGWCASSEDAERTYKKYGTSSACSSNGKGGYWANQVYKIIAKVLPGGDCIWKEHKNKWMNGNADVGFIYGRSLEEAKMFCAVMKDCVALTCDKQGTMCYFKMSRDEKNLENSKKGQITYICEKAA